MHLTWEGLYTFLQVIALPFVGAVWAIWWKVESRQDKKIDDLAQQNRDQHDVIHKKIDTVRDKIEDIWKHLVK